VGKNKLAKFADMTGFGHVFQYPYAVLQAEDFAPSLGLRPMKGHWREDFFGNQHPLVLELGCGRGEYTVGLGKLFPEKNFVGVDIKGARMWSGAKESEEAGMKNVAFLRTNIELLPYFFACGEVSEIWLTFPDPQMKKANKRLTSTRFMTLYREILSEGGIIHLKTDSPFLYTYTCAMAETNRYPILARTDDLYHSGADADPLLALRTCYEQQWLNRGLSIKYLRFVCEARPVLTEPDIDIEHDAYRSFNRIKRHNNGTAQTVSQSHP
jgi:tRNA (guanine-N7-)-methyltransferase